MTVISVEREYRDRRENKGEKGTEKKTRKCSEEEGLSWGIAVDRGKSTRPEIKPFPNHFDQECSSNTKCEKLEQNVHSI